MECAETELDVTTRATLTSALADSTDANPYVRDIVIATDDDGLCDSSTPSTIGALLNVTDSTSGESNCWQHVQGDTLNVYDFTYWSLRYVHPGNDAALDANSTSRASRALFVLNLGILSTLVPNPNSNPNLSYRAEPHHRVCRCGTDAPELPGVAHRRLLGRGYR